MDIEQLRVLMADRPFRRFRLETVGGNYLEVTGPDRLVFPPQGFELIFIYAPDGLVHHVTAQAINSYAIE